jgi:hypothetical protein
MRFERGFSAGSPLIELRFRPAGMQARGFDTGKIFAYFNDRDLPA